MSLQIIKSIDGKDEYVLIPINVFHALSPQIKTRLIKAKTVNEYVNFEPEDYVDNPIALARIKANLTQAELAKRMRVTQAYISKLEAQTSVSAKMIQKVKLALPNKK